MASDIKHHRTLPAAGLPKDDILELMRGAKANDADWRSGQSWSLVYYAGEAHTKFLADVYTLFMSENGLSPTAFPSLRRFEAEVVAMLRNLLEGDDDIVGTMTSGGTESILLSVKTYRDRLRRVRPEISAPEMILPASAHPAFFKAAHYFGVKPITVAVGEDFRVEPIAVRQAITDRTAMIVGSAPSFPQGVVDPIAELGTIAADNDVGMHVDACLGCFVLPFLKRLGQPVPPFDFSVPGVTSISADLHKYGYSSKGASAILYRGNELRRDQFFVHTDWPGGLYGSPGILGTRPGGAIAAAWAAMMSLGEDGYLQLARETLDLTRTLMAGIEAIPELHIIGQPDMTVFAFGSDSVDVFAVADWLGNRNWRLDRQRNPDCLHMIVTPNHAQSVGRFLDDLRQAVREEVGRPQRDSGAKAAMMYGVTTDVPEDGDLELLIYEQMEQSFDL